METFEIKPKLVQGVELTYSIKEHQKNKTIKLTLSFDLNGSGYNNAAELPIMATKEEMMSAIKPLDKWARTIIKENQS